MKISGLFCVALMAGAVALPAYDPEGGDERPNNREAPAATQTPSEADDQVEDEAADSDQEVVCRRVERTETRIARTTRVCMTRAQWRVEDRGGR